MKILKKIVICILISFSALAFCFDVKQPETTSDAAVLDESAFNYITLSQKGQVLDSTSLKTIDNNTYVITNNSVTISFKPFDHNYSITENTNLNNFFAPETPITIAIEPDAETGEYPTTFVYNERTYYYVISSTNQVNIYHGNPATSSAVASSTNSDLISYELDGTTRKIHAIISYTSTEDGYKDIAGNDSTSCVFEFRCNSNTYTLHFQEPIINFYKLTEPVVMFNTNKTDSNGDPFPAEKSLAPDQVFDRLELTFINNDYTEGNPLYFDINFNGFIYEYTLFSKVIDGENLLFVNYSNEYNNESENIVYNNSEYLASSVTKDDNDNIVAIKKVLAKNNSEDNQFSLIFNKTGRYSIEIYDSTHKLNMTNANHYSTSFFIRENSEIISPFQNIYIVAQTIQDNGTPIEYIVSNSTLNYSTRITVKNLGDFGKNTEGETIQLSDVIEQIIVKKTDFGIDHVETIDTVYSIEQIQQKLIDNDFTLEFNEDAYYQILVYPKTQSGNQELNPVHYVFTIVKHAKTTYTFNDKIYEATTPYKTEYRYYTNPINSEIYFNIKFSTSTETNVNLKKTYINRFNVKFGVKKVAIEKYTPEPENDDESVPAGVYVKVYGVGELTVYVTHNGQTEVLKLNSEIGNNTIDRTEYGKYTIRVVDSMGSETVASFNHKKSLNTSAIVLIVLISIIAGVVILFIVKARGRIATR